MTTNNIFKLTQFKFLVFALFAFLLQTETVHAKDIRTDSVMVAGNCGMCEKRIVTAAIGKGVRNASWNKNTKMLQVTYDADKTSMDDIEKRIAKAGHDTENHRVDDDVYEKLHSCCMYPRLE